MIWSSSRMPSKSSFFSCCCYYYYCCCCSFFECEVKHIYLFFFLCTQREECKRVNDWKDSGPADFGRACIHFGFLLPHHQRTLHSHSSVKDMRIHCARSKMAKTKRTFVLSIFLLLWTLSPLFPWYMEYYVGLTEFRRGANMKIWLYRIESIWNVHIRLRTQFSRTHFIDFCLGKWSLDKVVC